MASNRKAISVPLNGAEYLGLAAKSSAAGLSLPAYVRKCCGMSPWIVRGREMESRPREPVRPPSLAPERISVTVVLTGDEYGDMLSRARQSGTTVPQYGIGCPVWTGAKFVADLLAENFLAQFEQWTSYTAMVRNASSVGSHSMLGWSPRTAANPQYTSDFHTAPI